MDLDPPTPSGDPELDPILRVLREEHPDVDLVILPPERPAPVPDGETLDGQRRSADAAMGRVVEAYDELAAALPAPAVHVATWAPVGDQWHPEVRATHRDLIAPLDPVDLMRVVGDRLHETGWEVRLAGPRLIARHDGLLVTADPSPSTLIVAVAGQPLPVSHAALEGHP